MFSLLFSKSSKVPLRWHVRVVSVIAGIWICSIVVGFCVGLGSGEIPLHLGVCFFCFVGFLVSTVDAIRY